jgi:hypothetical protein
VLHAGRPLVVVVGIGATAIRPVVRARSDLGMAADKMTDSVHHTLGQT